MVMSYLSETFKTKDIKQVCLHIYVGGNCYCNHADQAIDWKNYVGIVGIRSWWTQKGSEC